MKDWMALWVRRLRTSVLESSPPSLVRNPGSPRSFPARYAPVLDHEAGFSFGSGGGRGENSEETSGMA